MSNKYFTDEGSPASYVFRMWEAGSKKSSYVDYLDNVLIT